MAARISCVWLAAACVWVLLGSTASSAVAATPAFDPMLSLTGDCSESQLDPVPDPGPCPGTAGVDHPAFPFSSPSAVATDAFGNIYVASTGLFGTSESEDQGSIDIFSPTGQFLTEVADRLQPTKLAVDSKGNLYVANLRGDEHGESVVRYEPTGAYIPAAGEISYDSTPTKVLVEHAAAIGQGLAVDPTTDQLYVKFPDHVTRYKSAMEGNEKVESFGFGLVAGVSGESIGIAVDAAHGRLYIGGWNVSACPCAYALELAPPHNLLFTITGSAVPAEDFAFTLSLAADEGTGDLYVYDSQAPKSPVYRFETSNSGAVYVATIEHGVQPVFGSEIGVDNGATSPHPGYLYVPSEAGGKGGTTGHSYAFGPPQIGPPEVEAVSFANVSEEEAELRAKIEPFGLGTHYAFEYLTAQQFNEQGGSFAGAQTAGVGEIPAGNTPVSVTGAATGLQPGVAYRFRVVASNEEGEDEGEGGFATYPAAQTSQSCAKEALRSGSSALLPDCRAYELVTPPDTNARAPRGTGSTIGAFFASPQASPEGGELSFELEGGSLPGTEAVGSFAGDPYLSSRGESGWSTEYAGPSGAEASSIQPGSTSPDQHFSLWVAEGEGSSVVAKSQTYYVRYPDGHSALVGRGSQGTDPRAQATLISESGGHIIFVSRVPLEPESPSGGVFAVYDRAADEVTHVVSLLPGGGTPPQQAVFEGASVDGKAVAFKLGKTLYVRYDDEETYEVGTEVIFAGFAKEATQAFYLEGGDLYRFDIPTGDRTPFTALGDVVPVNVAAGGSTAYFASSTAVSGIENPNHDKPVEEAGKWNLYRSNEGAISFVGTVAEEEIVAGKVGIGLGLWAPHVVTYGEVAEDPSRVNPNGGVLLFESHARLTAYDNQGHNEVYRYDYAADELDCLSCNPTLAPPEGGASLQSTGVHSPAPEPLGLFARVDNLAPDGNRAFFQSTEPLVPADNDDLQDVYEWEAKGINSCILPQGCLYLISSGHSEQIDYLFAVSNGGNDVFFRSGDILLPSDLEETPSVYDARVDGGFPEPESLSCEGEGCRPGLAPAPAPPSLASRRSGPSGNAREPKCPKAKHRIRRHGRVRCIKKHHHRRHHHQKAGAKTKGSGK